MKLRERPIAVFDTECTVDYWLIYFKCIESRRTKSFELFKGHPLDVPGVVRVLRNFTIVGFNSNLYDVPMLRLALRTGVTNQQLKRLNDQIIVSGMKPWEVEREYDLPPLPFLDHIDVIEPAPSVKVGLKLYMGRLNSKRLQDLPFDPADRIFDGTPGKRETTVSYCGNDLDGTEDLYRHIEKQIELRYAMSEQYGIDLRSKSDAQIAEAVIKSELERIKGEKLVRPSLPRDYSFKYKAPDFLDYRTDDLREVFQIVKDATFRLKQTKVKDEEVTDDTYSVGGVKFKVSGVEMPPEIKSLKIKIGGSTYKMGIGGLHSTEKKIAHHSDSERVLIDSDVASYYPAIMLNCELYPDHLGPDFLDIYRGIRERRIAAKRSKDKVTDMILKIVLNGTFGKLGSKWSVLYAPNLMLQVTITGQLALLMLIEELELAGISVISANTDGIVSKCPRHLVGKMYEITRAWEKQTGFDMEQAVYESLYSMSVNSYVAIKASYEQEKAVFDAFPFLRSEVEKGVEFKRGVKQKGLFAFVGSKGSPAEKNPQSYVCIDAVVAYLLHGTPIDETLEWCPDMRRFLTVRRVTGGATYDGEYIGKVVRWYHAKGVDKCIQYASNGNKVAGSDGAKPMMELAGLQPDIDFDHYRAGCHKMLGNLGVL